MDTKTKIQTVISIVLVTLVAGLAYWVQLPTSDLKAQLIDTDTVLVRIQDFTFDSDVVRIEPDTTLSWLHDESEGNADIQHTVTSYDPEDVSLSGDEFESELMSLGDTFSHTFDEPGVYNYNCSLHPFMTGKVCVGEESEILDEDCAISVTSVSDTVEDEDTLGDEVTLEEEDEDEDLLPAADEDFDTSEVDEDVDEDVVVDNDNDFDTSDIDDDTTQVYVPQQTTPQEQPPVVIYMPADEELSDSGPEDFFYVFVAMLAVFLATKWRKFASNK